MKRNISPMANTAMNFNSSLFDRNNKIPEGHFDEIEDSELERGDDDDMSF